MLPAESKQNKKQKKRREPSRVNKEEGALSMLLDLMNDSHLLDKLIDGEKREAHT